MVLYIGQLSVVGCWVSSEQTVALVFLMWDCYLKSLDFQHTESKPSACYSNSGHHVGWLTAAAAAGQGVRVHKELHIM